jgi:hypothetical protein
VPPARRPAAQKILRQPAAASAAFDLTLDAVTQRYKVQPAAVNGVAEYRGR